MWRVCTFPSKYFGKHHVPEPWGLHQDAWCFCCCSVPYKSPPEKQTSVFCSPLRVLFILIAHDHITGSCDSQVGGGHSEGSSSSYGSY